jgi:hypothetical protein
MNFFLLKQKWRQQSRLTMKIKVSNLNNKLKRDQSGDQRNTSMMKIERKRYEINS